MMEVTQSEIKHKYVIGSAGLESVIPLPLGSGYVDLNDASVYVQMEHKYGGSGLCNAIALRMGVPGIVRFTAPVGGKEKNRPDSAAIAISEYLEDMNIIPLLQVHPGEKTENTTILISGKALEGRAALKDLGSDRIPARKRFVLDDTVKQGLSESQFAIVSALRPNAILDIAAFFKASHGLYNGSIVDNPAFLALTLNKETADAVAVRPEMHKGIEEGLFDLMFFSGKAEGPEMRKMNGHMDEILSGIPIVVETLSEQGCSVTFDHEGQRRVMHIPPYPIEQRVNDNGAGEAHHNNFMGVIIAAYNRGLIGDMRAVDPMIIETAGRIANLAAAIKIQKADSLWFPRADMTAVGELLSCGLNGDHSIDATHIAAAAFSAKTI